MLPFLARRASQQVRGPGLGDERIALPLRARLAPKTEHARRKQRNADDVAEGWSVAVSADRGAGAVFGDQRGREVVGREVGEGGGAFAQRQQERRDVISSAQLASPKS